MSVSALSEQALAAGVDALADNEGSSSQFLVKAVCEAVLSALWQPIHTAPTDGTSVVLFGPEGYSNIPRAVVGFMSEDGHWYDWEGASNSLDQPGWWMPTHWLALPDWPRDSSAP